MTQCNHDVSWAEPGLYAARAMILIAELADVRFPAGPDGCEPGTSPSLASLTSKHLASQHEFSKMGAKPPVIRASGGRREIARCATRRATRSAALTPREAVDEVRRPREA